MAKVVKKLKRWQGVDSEFSIALAIAVEIVFKIACSATEGNLKKIVTESAAVARQMRTAFAEPTNALK